MTVPDWWQAVILVLASYRLTRLGGWDEWPPIRRVRAWVIGERWIPTGTGDPLGELRDPDRPHLTIDDLELPGKQPSSQVDFVRPGYDRPTLAHLVHCPFCLGWWVTLACWTGFEFSPHWALVALSPFALAGAVGLVGKDLD